MRLLWLPSVLRAAGLTVHEYDGWQARGSDTYGPIAGVVCHATAGSRTSTDASETRVLWVTGSTSAPAPISQLYLGRQGHWWVGASGRCNHVAYSEVRPASPLGLVGNTNLIGVEAANDNKGEPWPLVQLDSYRRGVAAICRHLSLPASRVAAHWEHQAGKTDPFGIDMQAFRARVGALITGEDDMDATQAAQLAEIHSLLTSGKRSGPNQTHTPAPGSGALYPGVSQPIAAAPYEHWRTRYEVRGDIAALRAEVRALRAVVEGMSSGNPDVQAILAGIDERLAEVRAEIDAATRDAVADLAEGGAAAVRGG